jgi:hypothetical protein
MASLFCLHEFVEPIEPAQHCMVDVVGPYAVPLSMVSSRS